ncbi:MAG: hypothetical protein OEL56_06390 [Nitrosopumilus sp.]|nr:hypothetical protein [Nitrosopumilus sp.]MDH3516134.1 hypothetical protein [Nitrosopumilus sp.]MDH3564620.1 hypothetical protein [Nitrosopumilus sp.]MDH5555584.1 hypothetical protein [Nitrosopumilus sp.]
MNKKGIIISIIGVLLIMISLSIATLSIPSSIYQSDNFSVPLLFEGMFDDVSNEVEIMPGNSAYFSYSVSSSNIPLMWGIQITDYQSRDKLSIKISNIFDDDYGTFIQDEPVLFEVLEITTSDTLNFEIENIGTDDVHVVMMFSEDPENSDALSNPNSPVMKMIFPLLVSGILVILGLIVLIVGLLVLFLDWKNYQNKRNY